MKQLGNAAHLLGIVGDDWDHLTVEQTDHYLDWLDAYEKVQNEANEKAKRRR
ncbi:hypothetical protein AB0H77_03735 [Streptomyces sp. NPDC050844]|uniref:hypothetical protein n=1 Tax=Streptomyces sp. NPDC050844 TaxID=3155790 RepID=UPI0033D95392